MNSGHNHFNQPAGIFRTDREDGRMIYDLMHKDTAVLRMRLNDESGLIESVEDVLSLRHLP